MKFPHMHIKNKNIDHIFLPKIYTFYHWIAKVDFECGFLITSMGPTYTFITSEDVDFLLLKYIFKLNWVFVTSKQCFKYAGSEERT